MAVLLADEFERATSSPIPTKCGNLSQADVGGQTTVKYPRPEHLAESEESMEN